MATIGIALFVAPALAFVMGSDDRLPAASNRAWPAVVSQVGIIPLSEDAFVSALLLGANCDVVISAGHAAFFWRNVDRKGWVKGQLRAGGAFSFVRQPGQSDAVELSLVESGYQQKEHIEDDQYDWAVFRSRRAIMQTCQRVSVPAASPHCAGTVLMAGFHFDMRGVRLVDETCKIRDVIADRLLIHDCDTKDGSSGAPLLCVESRGISLLGINISGLSQRSYVEPGVYGQSARPFDHRTRKNFAVAVHGDFLLSLERELASSRKRAAARSGAVSTSK